jgi:hypothetical protein
VSDTFRVADGAVFTDLPDHKGIWWTYRLAPLAAVPTWARWGCTFTKEGPFGPELAYTVHQTKGGGWVCTCPAWKYSKDRSGPCKHGLRGLEFLELLRDAKTALQTFAI